MRLTWATDVHLDFVPDEQHVEDFYAGLLAEDPTAILLSGDIANGHRVGRMLVELVRFVQLPVYFVLGNHDFYGRSVRDFRAAVTELAAATPNLHYLTSQDVVALDDQTALLGHDGWADARLGDFEGSDVFLNDFVRIDEFAYRLGTQRRAVMQELADEAAAHFECWLPQAAARHRRLFIVTHVPPFAEACRHAGQPSDASWLPHYSCKIVGDVLRRVLGDHPRCSATVLCGHTHGAADVQVMPNLRVLSGGVPEYGQPRIQRTFVLAQ